MLVYLRVGFTGGLVVVDTDAVQLEVTVPMIGTGGVDPMLITDHLPELRENKREREKQFKLYIAFIFTEIPNTGQHTATPQQQQNKGNLLLQPTTLRPGKLPNITYKCSPKISFTKLQGKDYTLKVACK